MFQNVKYMYRTVKVGSPIQVISKQMLYFPLKFGIYIYVLYICNTVKNKLNNRRLRYENNVLFILQWFTDYSNW